MTARERDNAAGVARPGQPQGLPLPSPHRRQGIDAGGAAGGDPARHQGDEGQEAGHGREDRLHVRAKRLPRRLIVSVRCDGFPDCEDGSDEDDEEDEEPAPKRGKKSKAKPKKEKAESTAADKKAAREAKREGLVKRMADFKNNPEKLTRPLGN